MNTKQRKCLERIFQLPTRADVPWQEIESLFRALGAEVTEGSGSRVCVVLNGMRSVFHRPHPGRIAGRLMVDGVRDFLIGAGVEP